MQRDNNIINSVEIVNVPPAEDNEVFDKADVPSGATELDKKDLQRLFQGRNLAFISSLSKDGSPHITPMWADMEDDVILIILLKVPQKARISKKILESPSRW